MSLTKLPSVRTPLSSDGVWIVPVSKVLRLGCLLNACRNPKCPCTELTVSVYSFDERVQAFGFKKGQLLSSSVPLDDQPLALDKPMPLKLDVYTGELSGFRDHPIDVTDRRVAAIADALDGETLDLLEELWRRQRGLSSSEGQRKAEIKPWEPGQLVYWDAVFEVDRPEAFFDLGRCVVACDMYCVTPSCDCRKVHIAFYDEVLPGEGTPPPIGRVVVSFSGGVQFESNAPKGDSRLRALWARYRRRHPDLRLLLDRYSKLRTFAADHTAREVARSNSRALVNVQARPLQS